jgi:hypothetical protein
MQLTFEVLSNEALSLPPEKRAALANKLLESLEGNDPRQAVEAEWAREIERRVQAFEHGELELFSGEEALESLKKKLQK